MLIRINIQIFAICILLVLTRQIEVYMWLMLFALVHELAHMFMGILLKLKPRMMKIEPFGINITFENLGKRTKNRISVAIAGPIMNLIIAFVFTFIHTKSQMLIINSNILLALFNLIPIYPLDGAKILQTLLDRNQDAMEVQRGINIISNILIIIITITNSILIIIYHNIGLFLISVYLWIIVMRENRRYLLKRKLYNLIEINK